MVSAMEGKLAEVLPPQGDLEGLTRRILRSLYTVRDTDPERDHYAREAVAQNYTIVRTNALPFEGPAAIMLEFVQNFWLFHAGPPSISSLREHARTKLKNTELDLYASEVEAYRPEYAADFHNVLGLFLEEHGKILLKQGLLETYTMATEGLETKVGREKKKEQGLMPALSYGMGRLMELRSRIDPRFRPIGPKEGTRLLMDEADRKRADPTLAYGMGLGIAEIDDATFGAQPGELWLIAGFTGHGKSTLILNWARYLATFGDMNILIYSLEMSPEQIWRILACGHSTHPKWAEGGGSWTRNWMDQPLEYKKLRHPRLLNNEEWQFYRYTLLPDLQSHMRGHIEVVNPEGGATMADVRARAEALNKIRPIDAIFIDYLGLLSPDRKFRGGDPKDVVNQNILAAKSLAMDFDHGGRIPVISPHQINRQGHKAAQANGGVYELQALADANQAERTGDVIFATYIDDALRQQEEAVFTHLKSRDSEVLPPFNVRFSVRHRLFTQRATTTGAGRQDLLSV